MRRYMRKVNKFIGTFPDIAREQGLSPVVVSDLFPVLKSLGYDTMKV